MTTVNISLPESLYEGAKKLMVRQHYASISELIRDALRRRLKSNITENGFTEEFEEETLRAAAEPDENDVVLETSEDIDNFFRRLILPQKHDKS